MKLTPRLANSNAVHLAKLSDAPLTGREKEYLVGRLLQTVHLNFAESEDNSMLGTKLFGTPFIPAEEDYPACPQCGGHMHNLFQLNFREAGLNIVPGCDLLVFYFCFKCNPLKNTEPGWVIRTYAEPEQMKARTDLIVPPIPGQPEVEGRICPVSKSCVQAAYYAAVDVPSIYTDPGVRQNIGRNDLAMDRYMAYLEDLRNIPGWHVRSKIGGWLECEQDPQYTRCRCGADLVHIATIKTDNYTPWVVGDIGAIYLAGCPDPGCGDGQDVYWWADWT